VIDTHPETIDWYEPHVIAIGNDAAWGALRLRITRARIAGRAGDASPARCEVDARLWLPDGQSIPWGTLCSHPLGFPARWGPFWQRARPRFHFAADGYYVRASGGCEYLIVRWYGPYVPAGAGWRLAT